MCTFANMCAFNLPCSDKIKMVFQFILTCISFIISELRLFFQLFIRHIFFSGNKLVTDASYFASNVPKLIFLEPLLLLPPSEMLSLWFFPWLPITSGFSPKVTSSQTQLPSPVPPSHSWFMPPHVILIVALILI